MKELYQIRETFETHLTGIRLGRDGQHKALCPFHDDNKTKSFSFNDEGLWKCFGCDKGGNIKQFAMELGIDWNGTASGYIKKPKPKEEAKPIDYSLLKLKAEEWHDNLMQPIFQMNEEERHKSKYSFYVRNLIGKNEQGIFTFPYFDDKGQVIAIKFHKDKDGQCRWYTNGNPDNTCKWYNGWNLSLYKPSKSLIIAEGEPDVIKLCSHGFQAICSSHGTNSVPPITPILKEWL
jgi:DNA primase